MNSNHPIKISYADIVYIIFIEIICDDNIT